jgi:hypothetical protein
MSGDGGFVQHKTHKWAYVNNYILSRDEGLKLLKSLGYKFDQAASLGTIYSIYSNKKGKFAMMFIAESLEAVIITEFKSVDSLVNQARAIRKGGLDAVLAGDL